MDFQLAACMHSSEHRYWIMAAATAFFRKLHSKCNVCNVITWHIGVTSFAIGWAVLEIWTTCLPNIIVLNYGEIWLFPKHTQIIRQLLYWWLQAQAKHIGVTSFAIGWAVLEIWTTCLPNCAKYTVKFGYFLNTLESSGHCFSDDCKHKANTWG